MRGCSKTPSHHISYSLLNCIFDVLISHSVMSYETDWKFDVPRMAATKSTLHTPNHILGIGIELRPIYMKHQWDQT